MPEAAVSQMAVYASRPTIRIDERDFERAGRLLLAMDMQEREGGLSALQMRFSNVASDPEGGADYAFEDEAELRLGASIAVYAGDRDARRSRTPRLSGLPPERSPPAATAAQGMQSMPRGGSPRHAARLTRLRRLP